jgi:2-dehydro-3-deoxyphosphogluconate aldolase / (4S)-4-hydroxy-2-oxoglutarate aldolase
MRLGPVIPVITIADAAHAIPMARALVAGGVRVLEITLRTPAALESVRQIVANVKEAIVGVGTVLQPRQFAEARAAGAHFAVTPGLTPELTAASKGLPLLPGVMTPSEVIQALEWGFSALKFFPAQQAGGAAMLEQLHGPFPELSFCPTGGIKPDTAPRFLALPNVACVGGSWLTPKSLLQAQDWEGIHRLALDARALRPA